ncbi:MAG: PKD domain-containing protein [Chloroflexota bacterium]
MSDDGRYVGFVGSGPLVEGVTGMHLFRYDRQTKTTIALDRDGAGAIADSAAWSAATSLVGPVLRVRDRRLARRGGHVAGGATPARVDAASRARFRWPADQTEGRPEIAPARPAISGDGNVVAFCSQAATNLHASKTDNTCDTGAPNEPCFDVFARDFGAGSTSLVSASTSGGWATYPGTVADGISGSLDPSLSHDGRYVSFVSSGTNLTSGVANTHYQVYVRDRLAGATSIASLSPAGARAAGGNYQPRITANGRYVAWYSAAANLVSGDTNGATDVFVRDLQAGKTLLASRSDSGAAANGPSILGTVSGDGTTASFRSGATNLVPGDTNGVDDAFMRDLGTASPPVAVIDFTPKLPLVGTEVTLDASGSYDANGSVVSYAWDLDGDGVFETGPSPDATRLASFANAGPHSVGVTVEDESGSRASATAIVLVQAEPGVSIDAGALYTRTTSVQLVLTPPMGADHVAISNDGGFANPVVVPIMSTVPWTLVSSGSERIPRIVYVRYRTGADSSATYSDDIILDQTPPTVTAPEARGFDSPLAATLAAAATADPLATSPTGYPARISWSGTDATSGISGYQLQRSVDGGSWATMTLSTPTSRSVVTALASGHIYRLRVRAKDGAGNWGSFATAGSFSVVAYQESSTSIVRRGTWSTVSSATAYGGKYRSARVVGAAFAMTFTGRTVVWFGPKSPSSGSARVYVDGIYRATINLQSTARSQRARRCSSDDGHLARGTRSGWSLSAPQGHPTVGLDALLVPR